MSAERQSLMNSVVTAVCPLRRRKVLTVGFSRFLSDRLDSRCHHRSRPRRLPLSMLQPCSTDICTPFRRYVKEKAATSRKKTASRYRRAARASSPKGGCGSAATGVDSEHRRPLRRVIPAPLDDALDEAPQKA